MPIPPAQATDPAELRKWRATEGLRQTELRLASQAANLTAMETRAASLLTWSVAGFSTLMFTVITNNAGPQMAAVSALLLFAAGACCILALRPQKWSVAGIHSLWDDAYDLGNITETLEAMSSGNIDAIAENSRRLASFGRFLIGAWILFLIAPLPPVLKSLWPEIKALWPAIWGLVG